MPFAIETSASATYTQTIDETGDVLYDENGVTVIAKIFTDSFLGHTVRLLIKNNTGKDILASADNVSVNGFTVNAWMHNAVYVDTVRYCELDMFASDLEGKELYVYELN